MQKNRSTLTGLTLAAVAAAGLSTAALAQKTPGEGKRAGGPGFGIGRLFAEIDTDKDGRVTRGELDAWKAAQPRVVDTDGDGKISAAELAAPRIAEATRRANERAAEMVGRLDADGDGLLSAAEMAQAPGFGAEGRGPDIGAIFDRLDTDKDGAVSLAEAEAMRGHDRSDRGEWQGRGMHGRDGDHGPDRGPGKGKHRPPMPGGDLPPPPPEGDAGPAPQDGN